MSEELDHEKALEKDLETASEEDKAIVREGLGKTTAIDRQFIRDQVAEGLMRPSEAARKYSISPQYVGKLLKQAGISFGSRKIERERKAKEEADAKEAAVKASFSQRMAVLAEEHKMSAIAQFRSGFLLEGMRQRKWREAAMSPTGAALPSPKEAVMSARTMVLYDQRIRILLELDTTIDEKMLPEIEINDMGDAEIAEARRGQVNDDTLVRLDDDVIEEAP